ncbi:hypothetical protein L484_011753 [Morus notabilis]|uniref:Uncharacterized protein n=1 Tax=Morus notabilis TaxID=981085 RepID=W9RUP8_9ROSA|nr:hypothetical protein L484_011753 [Morus notabilis]
MEIHLRPNRIKEPATITKSWEKQLGRKRNEREEAQNKTNERERRKRQNTPEDTETKGERVGRKINNKKSDKNAPRIKPDNEKKSRVKT